MRITVRHYGKYIELRCDGANASFTEVVSDGDGKVNEELIEHLRYIADVLEEHNEELKL